MCICFRGTSSDVSSLLHGSKRHVRRCYQSQKHTSTELPTSSADTKARGSWRKKNVCEHDYCGVIYCCRMTDIIAALEYCIILRYGGFHDSWQFRLIGAIFSMQEHFQLTESVCSDTSRTCSAAVLYATCTYQCSIDNCTKPVYGCCTCISSVMGRERDSCQILKHITQGWL